MSELTTEKSEVTSNKIDVEKLIAENQALKASKNRILNESKDYKAKAQELDSMLKIKETAELEKQGEYEKLLQQERLDKQGLLEQIGQTKKRLLRSSIKEAVSKKAKDAVDVELLLRLPEADGILYDEDTLEVDEESIDKVISSVRASRDYLFTKGKIATQATGNPISGEDHDTAKVITSVDSLKGAKVSDLYATLETRFKK